MYDLIVIGGGPAALAATYYAIEKRLNAMMLYAELGGKVGWSESLVGPIAGERLSDPTDTEQLGSLPPLPANDLVRLLARRVMQAGYVMHDSACSIAPGDTYFSIETESRGMLQATTVIVATGASPRRIAVPGAERLSNVGLSYSVTTYAHLCAGKRVAVLGNTMRALRGTVELSRTAEHVYLVITRGEQLATSLGQALQRLPNVTCFTGYQVTQFIGSHTVEAVEIAGDEGVLRLDVQQAFADFGLVPNSDLVRAVVNTDAYGFIMVDYDNVTSVPGLYAAGDVTTRGSEQVLIAVGDGTRAAVSAYNYLLVRSLAQR